VTTAGEPKTSSAQDLQNDTTLVKDTSNASVSSTALAQQPAQKTLPSKPKPEGWKGLGYWLATTDRKEVEDTLCAIRDDFFKQTKTQTKTDNTRAAQQNGQAAGSWRQATSSKSSTTATADQAIDPVRRETVLREAVMYGEMVQAVYDTLQTKDEFSADNGLCAEPAMREGQSLGAEAVGKYTTLGDDAKQYTVLKQIKADSGAYKLVIQTARKYVGIIAEGKPDPDDGGVDIAIVYRGTITGSEWFQDFKALKARWRQGEQPKPAPDIYVTAFPFQSHLRVALGTAMVAFVFLTSSRSNGIIQWATDLHVGGFLSSVGGFALGVMNFIFEKIIGVDRADVNVDYLSGSVFAGMTAYVLWGLTSAWLDKPKEWWGNIKGLAGVAVPWTCYFAVTVWDSFAGRPHSDPRVEFGFKEMYCDALDYRNLLPPSKSSGKKAPQKYQKSEECETTPAPRLTVYTELNNVLTKYAEARKNGSKIHVRSITITGHSLGGALASLCGFDLATAVADAVKAGDKRLDTSGGVKGAYCKTHEQRKGFHNAIQQLVKEGQEVPKVAVVSWAAPRVGDQHYAKALGHRTVMNPMGVLERWEPAWPWEEGFWGNVPVFFRDWVTQFGKLPWYGAAVLANWLGDLFHTTRSSNKPNTAAGSAENGSAGASKTAAAHPGPGVGMLRLVNAHDFVPRTPPAVPFPGFIYVHGGYELLLNSYRIDYFKNTWLGADAGNRHNMEMYLHLLDSSRDKALVNKSADLLNDDAKVPGFWWDPIPHKGLTYGVHDDTKQLRWYGPRKPEDGTAAAGQEEQACEMGYSRMDGKDGAAAAGQEAQGSKME